MKMTDESALDVLDRLVQDLGSITEDDAIGLQNYLRARLAADQQKGGGEDVPWGYYTLRDGREEFYNLRNSTNFRQLTDMLQRGVTTLRDAFPDDAVLLYTAPQPSIPAPAQQDGKASGGEATVPACRRCGSTNLKNVSTKGGEGKSCVECGNFRFNGPEDAR